MVLEKEKVYGEAPSLQCLLSECVKWISTDISLNAGQTGLGQTQKNPMSTEIKWLENECRRNEEVETKSQHWKGCYIYSIKC